MERRCFYEKKWEDKLGVFGGGCLCLECVVEGGLYGEEEDVGVIEDVFEEVGVVVVCGEWDVGVGVDGVGVGDLVGDEEVVGGVVGEWVVWVGIEWCGVVEWLLVVVEWVWVG